MAGTQLNYIYRPKTEVILILFFLCFPYFFPQRGRYVFGAKIVPSPGVFLGGGGILFWGGLFVRGGEGAATGFCPQLKVLPIYP